MLTGQIPHEAETPIGIVLKRLTEPLPLPRSLNGEIPEAVERVILKALAREPDNRFASAGELAEALKAAVSGSALETVPLVEKEEPTVLSPEVVTPAPALSEIEGSQGEGERTFGRRVANLDTD